MEEAEFERAGWPCVSHGVSQGDDSDGSEREVFMEEGSEVSFS